MRHLMPCLALALAAAALPAAAGVVEVRVAPTDTLSDAGPSGAERERNVQQLTDHVRGWAAQLPADQTLRLEVTDLDLAGRLVPTRHGGEVRLLTGRADGPSVTIRWTLHAGDRLLAQGDERLSDLSYLTPLRGRDERALGYEIRMIDRWFDERVRVAAAR